MPRLIANEAVCPECLNAIHSHEGPKLVRRFAWPVRTVAHTLGLVAAGKSYVGASQEVRTSRGRERGMLASDWVEAFADDLWRELGPKRWPQFLVADAKTFYLRRWGTTGRPRRGNALRKSAGFTLMVVVGADAPAVPSEHWKWQPVYAHLIGGSGVTAGVWSQVLRSLPGRPLGVTSDFAPAFFRAVDQTWPLNQATGETRPAFNLCLHHASQNLAEFIDQGPAGDQVRALLDQAMKGPQQWQDFAHAAEPHNRGIRRWLNKPLLTVTRRDIITTQLSQPWPCGPNSNSAAESTIRAISGLLSDRYASFRNAERTNLLLKLMLLHERGTYNEQRWAAAIDHAAQTRNGTAARNLRALNNAAGRPTLR